MLLALSLPVIQTFPTVAVFTLWPIRPIGRESLQFTFQWGQRSRVTKWDEWRFKVENREHHLHGFGWHHPPRSDSAKSIHGLAATVVETGSGDPQIGI